jgi:hypothetical protein
MPDEWITAADLMTGPTIPMRLRLHVTLRPDDDRPSHSSGGFKMHAPKLLLEFLSRISRKMIPYQRVEYCPVSHSDVDIVLWR